MSTDFTLNGAPASISGEHEHLLGALRDELSVFSPKDGCSPTGQCGCCTVLVNGKARVACQTSLEKTEGATIVTLEGLDEVDRSRMADAFAAFGALQCGFCTPGILMRTKAMLDKDPQLTRDKAARLMGGNLCRCTGYTKILDAVEALVADEVPVAVQPRGVGTRGIKYEAHPLALGDRPFIDDMVPANLAHGAFKLTDHARADIEAIDTTAAEAVPGVVRVLTAADVPGELRHGLIHKDWPVFIPIGGRTSYMGDVIAMVVAEDRNTARHAATLVEVTYNVHEPIVNPMAAIESDDDAVWELDGNVLSTSTYSRGDAEAGLAGAAHVVRETFQPQRIDHAFLEPESTLAVPVAAGQPLPLTNGDTAGDPAGQRRHVEPRPNRAGFMAAATAGQDHVQPRRISARSHQAPPDPHGLRSRLRCPGESGRSASSHGRRLGAVCLGWHEGSRTGGRTCVRPVRDRKHRRRSHRRSDQ